VGWVAGVQPLGKSPKIAGHFSPEFSGIGRKIRNDYLWIWRCIYTYTPFLVSWIDNFFPEAFVMLVFESTRKFSSGFLTPNYDQSQF
jgi:hypothetical protein